MSGPAGRCHCLLDAILGAIEFLAHTFPVSFVCRFGDRLCVLRYGAFDSNAPSQCLDPLADVIACWTLFWVRSSSWRTPSQFRLSAASVIAFACCVMERSTPMPRANVWTRWPMSLPAGRYFGCDRVPGAHLPSFVCLPLR